MMPLVKIRSKKIFQDLLTLRNRLKQENTLYLKAVLARNISLMRRMFWCFKILSVYVCLHSCRQSRRQRRHEMNMSASVSLKPAVSHFYSFVLSLLYQLVNNILVSTKQRKKL